MQLQKEVFAGPVMNLLLFIKLYFLVLLYWLVWIKNNLKKIFCVEWIINCLSNNQKYTTEGNANITVLFYEITERVESKFWSFKKNSKQAQA